MILLNDNSLVRKLKQSKLTEAEVLTYESVITVGLFRCALPFICCEFKFFRIKLLFGTNCIYSSEHSGLSEALAAFRMRGRSRHETFA